MDNLRIFYELLHKYKRKQNYDNEYKALFRPMIVDAIPDMISLDLVFKIVDIHQFNINMFAIHGDNNFKTTEDVKAFLKEENYNFERHLNIGTKARIFRCFIFCKISYCNI